MTTSIDTLPFETSPEYKPMHPVWKLLNAINASIVVLGALMFMILLPMFALSAMRNSVLEGLLTLFGGMGAVVLITTQASWYRTWYPSDKEEAQEDLESMVRKAKSEAEEEPKLTYRQTLIQHATTMVLFVPFYLTAFGMLYVSINSGRAIYLMLGDKNLAEIILKGLIVVSFFMAAGGYTISHNVARNRHKQAKSRSERMSMGVAWAARAVSYIVMMIIAFAVLAVGLFLPLFLIGEVLIATEAHPIFLPISMLAVLGVFGFVMMAVVGRYMKRLQTKSNAVIKETVAEEFGEGSEEYQEVIEEIRQREFGTPEQNMYKYVLPMMLGMLILAVLATMVAQMLLIDADEGVREGVSALVLGVVGLGGIMMGFRVISNRYEHQLMAKIGPLAQQIDAATAQCDWVTATELADQLLEVQPDVIGHTSAAITYMIAGQTDKAEYLIHKSLERTMAGRSEDNKEIPPTVILHLHPLALIQLADGQYDAAEKTLKRMLKLEPKSADAYYTLVDLELYRNGSGEQAQKFLNKAKKHRGSNEQPSDKGILSSQAWIDARLGRHAEAVANIEAALKLVDKENKVHLADHYLTRGYVAREMGKHVTAEAAFNKVLALDSDGLLGKLARRALNA